MPTWLEAIPFVAEGGTIMLILYGVSLLGLALVLERALALKRSKVLPGDWSEQLRATVADGGWSALGKGAGWPDTPAANALREFLRHPAEEAGEAREQVDWVVSRNTRGLERGLTLLGLLAALAPLLGLLGTVAGMIETFRGIAAGGLGDPQLLADGIYQALYTTAAGLTLAIPLTIAYRIYRGRADLLADEVADFLEQMWWTVRRRSSEDVGGA